MIINFLKGQKQYFYFFLSSLILVIIIGILSPYFINSISSDWEILLEKKLYKIEKETLALIKEKENSILKLHSVIEDSITIISKKDRNNAEEIFKFINKNEFNNFSVEIINNENQLIAWTNTIAINPSFYTHLLSKYRSGESFFFNSDLSIYFCSFNIVGKYKIFVGLPIEKKYIIKNSFYEPVNFTQYLNDTYQTEFNITYSSETKIVKDGRKFSFPIYNNYNNLIGTVSLVKPSRDAELINIRELVFTIQSLLALIAFIFLGIGFYPTYKKLKSRSVKIFLFSIYLIAIRVLIFLFIIPSKYLNTEFVNPVFFSSSFGYGIVKSPLELFLTIITILLILLFSYKNTLEYIEEKNNAAINKLISIPVSVLLLFIYFIILRIFGSALNSVIFDSSILYFKETYLLPDSPTALMYLNVLLFGFGSILSSVMIILLFLNLNKRTFKNETIILFISSFILFQIFGFIFDFFQYQPQTTPLIRILYILISFLISYYILIGNVKKLSTYVVILFSGSIISISLLNDFNTQLEKNSLKTTAFEITRSNLNLLDYLVGQSLTDISKNGRIKEIFLNGSTNYEAEAFIIWSNSPISRESKGCIVNIINDNKMLLGSFNYQFDEIYQWDWTDDSSDLAENKIIHQNIYETENIIIRGIIPIFSGEQKLGYVEISLLYDVYSLGFEDRPEFISSGNPFARSSVNINLLKIFEFHDNELINYFTDVLLSDEETEKITHADFSVNNDVWINMIINGEDYTVYVRKIDKNGFEKIIAITQREKDISWNLFDFFKVFFVHIMMIMIILLFVIVFSFPKEWKIKFSFKTKLLLTLVVVSVIPLILLASYFKNLTDEKNDAAINYKLGKRADNVEDYLNTYIVGSTLSELSLYEKAVRDLGIEFALYDNEKLIFSSQGVYYRIGLISKFLNPIVYSNLFFDGKNEFVIEESIDKYKYNSFFHKSVIGGNNYILKVSDVFNRIQLPMTGAELDIFLFGTYSLAVILIIILSTILANQISSPIYKLTKATRSVSHGDLDIQVDNRSKGEIKELTDGFNLMVRELKKSQIELAEVERESAWKEMAKQVAHEIKNPLTPMKLAVQHLIIAKKDKSTKFDEIFEKVTATLVNQIDNLKNIASEFSSFAKMPSLKLERLDLKEIAVETIDLFIEEKCSIKIFGDNEKYFVHTDREQFQRMLINMIRNSIQAEANSLTINLEETTNAVLIEVSDNGTGISNDIAERIFDENFSTKSKGMGLGLSMAKRFVELTGGELKLKTTSAEGTTFIIIHPKV